jgi:lipopolysaccharide transport system ATP-binding protein
MMDTAIKVEHLSKAYQIGQIGTGTISRDLERFWVTKVRRKEDPFLKIGEANDRSVKGESDIVWSLRDINFEVGQGEAVGIIGKNGAGKSTLLKLLSRVTGPTSGEIKIKGRIASLLEVGTGFHPELTGRENIFLNGAILGMRKKEIKRKLDEIIDFSGVARYVDTPVKRYSSGMYVRLAFAVAAHLESEILIVDEVLAVGDAEFQKKCLGKMSDISKGQGRTVLFVSHNMASVKNLCQKGILLENGQLRTQGGIDHVIDAYLYETSDRRENQSLVEFENKRGDIYVKSVSIASNENGKTIDTGVFPMGTAFTVAVNVANTRETTGIKCSIVISSASGLKVCAIRSHEMHKGVFRPRRDFQLSVAIRDLKLMPGDYLITVGLAENNETISVLDECLRFTVVEDDIFQTGFIPKGNFVNYADAKWEINEG